MESFGLLDFLKSALISSIGKNAPMPSETVTSEPTDSVLDADKTEKSAPVAQNTTQNAFLSFMAAHEKRAKQIKKT